MRISNPNPLSAADAALVRVRAVADLVAVQNWNAAIRFAEGVRDSVVASHPQVRVGSTPAAASASSGERFVTAVIPDELVPFFQCVIHHESYSAGMYSAVQQPSGKYRGAYQADASFWRAYAPDEWKHLADSYNWETAPPEVQDQAALNGYRARGGSPWNGSGC